MIDLYDYQKQLLTGFKPGELSIWYGGQYKTGQSTVMKIMKNHMYGTMGKEKHFRKHSEAIVDGDTWYTVGCSNEASIWFRKQFAEQEDKMWHEHIDKDWAILLNRFDMHEKLYIMLGLRWS
jgi:hypothetical protein